MREWAPVLEDCIFIDCNSENRELEAINKLFDFDYDMPECYKPIFEKKFFKRYRYYTINYDSYNMFKNQLESKIIELLPRYIKLYESESIITNPFINVAFKKDSFKRNQNRRKNIAAGTGNNSSHNSNQQGSISVNRAGTSAGGNSSVLGSGEGVTTNKDTHDDKGQIIKRFTDSPQSRQDPEDKLFNDGYITTLNSDTSRNAAINSGVGTTWNKDAQQSTNDSYSNTSSYGDNTSEGEARAYSDYYSDSLVVDAFKGTLKEIDETYGLNGKTVSDVLNEWRTTFINIDKMFLDELRALFMRVF